jgi:septal ring factor EnvC (AmiA/AmiB activator)
VTVNKLQDAKKRIMDEYNRIKQDYGVLFDDNKKVARIATRLDETNKQQLIKIEQLKDENQAQADTINQNKQDYETLSQRNEALLAEIERLKQVLPKLDES